MAQAHGYKGIAVIVTAHISEALILSVVCGDPLPWAPAPTPHMLVSGAPHAEAYRAPVHPPGGCCWRLLDPTVQGSHGSRSKAKKLVGWLFNLQRDTYMHVGHPLCSQDLCLTQHLSPCPPLVFAWTRSQCVLGIAEASLVRIEPFYLPPNLTALTFPWRLLPGVVLLSSFLAGVFLYFLDFFSRVL